MIGALFVIYVVIMLLGLYDKNPVRSNVNVDAKISFEMVHDRGFCRLTLLGMVRDP